MVSQFVDCFQAERRENIRTSYHETMENSYISKEDFSDFSHDYMLKVDVDSIYFGHNSFRELMDGFGASVKFFVDSRKSRIQKANTSRFGLCLKNNGIPKVDIGLNGVNPDKIRLDYFPNIKLMECQVDMISPRFFVNMYFVGVGNIRRTTYFSDLEVKAVTALLNCAREDSISILKSHLDICKIRNIDAEMRAAQVELETFCEMHLFESITGGSQDARIKNRPTCLSHSSAIIFAESFDAALEKYTSCRDEEFQGVFSSPVFVGSYSNKSGLARMAEIREMRLFLERLKRGVFFCASCAGCKQDFYRKEDSQIFLKYDSSTPDMSNVEFHRNCNRMKDLALIHLKKCLFGNAERTRNTDEDDEDYDRFYHYIDLGIEISPINGSDSFFLKGRGARDAARFMLRNRNLTQEGGGDNPNLHVMGTNLVLAPADRELLDYGSMLRLSEGNVFEYGEDEGEGNLMDEGCTNDDNGTATQEEERNEDVMEEEEHYIYQEDNADYAIESEGEENEAVPSTVVNLYNQMDTRGEIGSVHSGRVLLKASMDEDGKILIGGFASQSKLTGVSMYNPKTKHNGMVRAPLHSFSVILHL